jgi:hypothetical protein
MRASKSSTPQVMSLPPGFSSEVQAKTAEVVVFVANPPVLHKIFALVVPSSVGTGSVIPASTVSGLANTRTRANPPASSFPYLSLRSPLMNHR